MVPTEVLGKNSTPHKGGDMDTRCGWYISKKWWILLFCLVPALSCTTVKQAIWPPTPTPTPTVTPTPTATPTPTPTPIPIAKRDFRTILLRSSDLPEGFIEIDLPDLEESLKTSLGEAGVSQLGVIMENLETGFASLFISQESEIYADMILVYTDGGYAQAAYAAYYDLFADQADEVDAERIGQQSSAFDQSMQGMTAYIIIWQYQEAVLNVQYAGEDGIELEELIRLAQLVQSRLETE
jgi:hypothetical protein